MYLLEGSDDITEAEPSRGLVRPTMDDELLDAVRPLLVDGRPLARRHCAGHLPPVLQFLVRYLAREQLPEEYAE